MSKVVAISGGFGCLGIAVGEAFAANGWRVALIDQASVPRPLADTARSEELLIGAVDLTDLHMANCAMQQVQQHFQGLDALINVAGGFRWETIEGGDLATWDLMYQMNVRTAATASMAALTHLKKAEAGRIINIAAGAASKASLGMGAYAAAKSGVMRLTEAFVEELKDQRITVNAIMPSIIDTPQNRLDMPDADATRWVTPEQVANVIVFLASQEASAITGAAIAVNGRC